MSFIELLFILLSASVLIIGINYALQDIKAAEAELEEVKKQLKQEKEDNKLLVFTGGEKNWRSRL